MEVEVAAEVAVEAAENQWTRLLVLDTYNQIPGKIHL